jgi:hypothetical protein
MYLFSPEFIEFQAQGFLLANQGNTFRTYFDGMSNVSVTNTFTGSNVRANIYAQNYTIAGEEDCRPGICLGRRRSTYVNVSSSANSTTLLSNLNISLVVPANSSIRIYCKLMEQAGAATTGIRLQTNTTGSPVWVQTVYSSFASATAMESLSNASTTSNWFQDTGSSTTYSPAEVITDMQTGTNPSNFTIEATGEVAAAWAIKEGSYCEYERRV